MFPFGLIVAPVTVLKAISREVQRLLKGFVSLLKGLDRGHVDGDVEVRIVLVNLWGLFRGGGGNRSVRVGILGGGGLGLLLLLLLYPLGLLFCIGV